MVCIPYRLSFLFPLQYLSLSLQINPGGEIPETYYLTNQTEASREEMERVVVRRGSSHEVEYQVDLPRSVLKYVESGSCEGSQ